ncbi:MAG: hypothetical protein M1812_003874 [Candelaria pacifica]|nr:MAG: hypothetical protein M1812_003874 [Candelaria pacifica]
MQLDDGEESECEGEVDDELLPEVREEVPTVDLVEDAELDIVETPGAVWPDDTDDIAVEVDEKGRKLVVVLECELVPDDETILVEAVERDEEPDTSLVDEVKVVDVDAVQIIRPVMSPVSTML